MSREQKTEISRNTRRASVILCQFQYHVPVASNLFFNIENKYGDDNLKMPLSGMDFFFPILDAYCG